jgi:site-specific recombinase XerD
LYKITHFDEDNELNNSIKTALQKTLETITAEHSKTAGQNQVSKPQNTVNKTKKEDIQVTKPDVLKFMEYLKNRNLQKSYRSQYLNAINHYFTFLYQEGKIAKNPCLFLKMRGVTKKTLYKIYTPEELEQLFDAYYQLFVRNYDDSYMRKHCQKQSRLSKERNALALSILFNQGATTSEIEKIELSDIDLIKATLKIRGSKKSNERVLPLKATQIGLFMNYLQKIRPQLLAYHKTNPDKLFLPLTKAKYSGKEVHKEPLMYAFFALTNQLKSIDKQFLNVLQVRASVITFWIKTQGLRKAQYLAGHRYVSSTERYLHNNLDGLIDDINKLHPFDF